MEDAASVREEGVQIDPAKETEIVFRCMAVIEDLNGRAIDILMHWLRVIADEETGRRIEEHAEGYMLAALKLAIEDMERGRGGEPSVRPH